MDRKQHIAIFTTASLPWMTGTAVNPLFRAAYLAKDGERKITLVIPWLSLKDQKLVYPNNTTFGSPSEQESYIRQWLEERIAFISGFVISFYPGKFAVDKRSILPVGDISEIIPDEEADIAVLEEPEHLTWFHHGKRWKTKFRLVIGIIHTNYLEYVRREKNGQFQAFLLKYVNNWVVSIYCHKVIRLSAATQDYPRSIICNVHGVNPKFLGIGRKRFERQQSSNQSFTKGAYYIGKMVWSKGYEELLKLLHDHQKELADLEVDLYGNGEDSDQVKEAASKLKLTVRVLPGRDHADPLFHDYKVFLNPSTTDVVCTTTAEALAMGKIVVCANHPSNDFFKQFPNCRIYDDGNDFVEATIKALGEEPVPLTDAQRYELSWEAATERFLRVSFHPFGGAVDIIVVEQPDGSFKTSPWYVRFGKFQGVLKMREKVVSICVNGIEANFHMFLDHKGEAHFLREVDVEEGESEAVSFPFPSGYETDEPLSGNRRPMKSKSCNYDANKSNSAGQIDVGNGKILSRTTSRRSRIFGLFSGQRSRKEDGYQEGVDVADVVRLDSLERAEIAADLLEVKWSTNLTSNRSNNNASRFSSTNDALENKGSEEHTQINDEENLFHSSVRDQQEKNNDEKEQFHSPVHDEEENSIGHQTLLEETKFCNKEEIICSHSGLENLEYSVDEASIQVSCVSTEHQIVETSSLGEGFIKEKCKVIANISGSIDDHSIGNSDHNENEMGAVSVMTGPDLQSQYKLEACMDKEFDEEPVDNERNVVLPGCGNSNKETVSESLQSFVYSKTSESSVVTLDGSSEQTHETLSLSDVGNGKIYVHAETLVTTTELMPEVTVIKQTEDMELDSEGALTVSESCSQMVSIGPVIGLEEMKSHSFHSTSTISDFGDQVEDEKNTKDVVRCSLEFVDDSQNFYRDSDPKRSVAPSESSEDEQFVFSDLDELKLHEPDCVNKDLYPSICTENEEVNGLCDVNNDSNPESFVWENPSNALEHSEEKSRIISNPISISRNHRVAGENNGLQVESLPNMWSPAAKFDAKNHRPVSHSLDSNSETMKWTSIRKDDSSCIRSDADAEQPLEHERSSSEESETSGKLKNSLYNPAVEISLCKHLLYEGMGAEAACQVFDAEKLDSKNFSSLGPAVVKNDKLVVRIGGHYFPWDEAAPIILGMATFGSEEIFEPKGMIPVDRVDKSIEGDPSKAIVSPSGSWRLWPFSLKRSRSRKAVQPAPADTRDLDADNAADITVASEDDKNLLKSKQVKKMKTPTTEQLASLNLKDGMNHITFTFSTAMLGKQQVDARIYLWKWNTRIVISDVDGTITKSDVLGQFMPLVGIDWSQTGVAHLFSAIKENGYQLLFLSARAISQAYLTRQFLVNLKQDGKALPDGPIVISPDGLFPSLYREVIRRAPHEFKIACLEEIKALFPSDCNPFYAGFGNRDTDEISYMKVGIPKGKIFIINPKGEVAVNRRVDTKSYSSLHALVHGMFPPTASSEQEDFNSWNFWKLPPPLIDI